MCESTIDIQCWFIYGSDALGCKVVLLSDFANESAILLRNTDRLSASGQLNLARPIVGRYREVLAYGIDLNNTPSGLKITGNLIGLAAKDTQCSGIHKPCIITMYESMILAN